MDRDKVGTNISLRKTVEISLREHWKQGPVAVVFNLIPGTNLTRI